MLNTSIFHKEGTRLRITLPKEMDHHSAEEIRAGADHILETELIQQIIFDFSNTEFMDSSGIGMVLGRYKKIQFMGGNVSLEGTSDRIRRILEMGGVYQMIMKEEKGR